MTESNVAISADSAATGAHNVRTVTVTVDNSDVVAGGQNEEQQVVTLASSDGQLLDLDGGMVPVASPEIAMLLRAILLRLDMLNVAVDRSYIPPDNLYEEV